MAVYCYKQQLTPNPKVKMFTQDIPSLTVNQISAVESAVESLDDLIESATSFTKNGGQSYRAFLADRSHLITKICELPNSK